MSNQEKSLGLRGQSGPAGGDENFETFTVFNDFFAFFEASKIHMWHKDKLKLTYHAPKRLNVCATRDPVWWI